MLSASFDLDSADGTLDVSLDGDDLYFRTNPDSQRLEYDEGATGIWKYDLGGDGPVVFPFATDFTITIGTGIEGTDTNLLNPAATVYLAGLETMGTKLTVTSAVSLEVTGDINTGENGLTLEVSDTINIAGGTLAHTQSNITIGQPDTGFLSGADSNADGRVTITGGTITIKAAQTEKKSQRQVVGQDSITAKIDISGTDIVGDSVTITAQSKDLSYGDEQPWYGNYVQPIVVDTLVDGLLPTVPAGIFVRESTSAVSIADSDITSTADLTIVSDSTTDASTTAIAARPFYLDTKGQTSAGFRALNFMSFGLTSATGAATVEITGSGVLESQRGDVAVKANTSVTSSVSARTSQNINAASPAAEGGGSFSFTLSDTTATAHLGENASINAPQGNVAFKATGDVKNTGTATSSTYNDGTAGVSLALGNDVATIKATVDGEITTAGVLTVPPSFDSSDIGADGLTITIPDHGLQDGETVQFLPQDPTVEGSITVGQLVAGDEVQVRVLDKDTIQLYLAGDINLRNPAGDPDSVQTLSLYDALEFNPQLSVVGDSFFSISNHPFHSGQAVRYSVLPPTDTTDPDTGSPSEPIDGLYDGTTYYVIVSQTNPDQFQLAASEAEALTVSEESVVTFTGFGQGTSHFFSYVSESRNFSPANDLDEQTNQIDMDTSDISTGDPLLYEIDPTIQNTQVIERNYGFAPEGVTHSFDPSGSVDFGQPVLDSSTYVLTIPNHGWETGQGVTYSTRDENGVASTPILVGDDSELTDGASYQVIRVDDHTIQLAFPEFPATALELVDGSESGIQQLSGSGQSHFFDPAGTVEWQTVDTIQNTVLFETPHGLVTGQRVTYSPGQNDSGQPNSPIGGLVAGKDYYVIKISDYEIQLSQGRIGNPKRDIFDGLVSVDDGAVDLGIGATGTTDSLHQFFGHTVDTLNDWIISPNHELETGQAVVYNGGDGTALGGLIDGMTYYAIRLDGNTIRLADSLEDASTFATAPVNVIDQSQLLVTESGFINNLFQSFQPGENNITGASVRTSLYHSNAFSADITIGLYDQLPGLGGNLLASGAALNVPPGEWAVVNFGVPVSVTPGATYYLEVQSSDTVHAHFYGTLEDSYSKGQMFGVDGTAFDHDFAFQTFTSDSENASYLSLDSAGTGPLQTLVTDSFVFPVEASRSEAVVNTTKNTIELVGHGLTHGQKVNYQASGGQEIGGLTDDTDYVVLTDGLADLGLNPANYIQLATLEVSGAISLSPGATLGTGLHLFRVIPDVKLYNREDPVIVFDPTTRSPFTLNADTLRVPGHGLSTGDSVRYLTGGGEAIGGLTNGDYYLAVVVDDNHLQFTELDESPTPTNAIPFTSQPDDAAVHGVQVQSTVTQSDLPVIGLGGGITYYAIVDGPNALRLAASPQEAFLTAGLSLVASDGTLQSPSETVNPIYTLDGVEMVDGIWVNANLKAKNTQNAGTLVGSAPTLSDLLTKPEIRFSTRAKTNWGAPTPPDKDKLSKKDFYAVAGVGVNLVDHDVQATVDSTLSSTQDVVVNSGISQSVQTKAQGNLVAGKGKKFAFSAGFAWTDVQNTSYATVAKNAKIDAPGTVDVKSEIVYPLLVAKKALIPLSFEDCWGDADGKQQCHPIKDLSTYLDGSFGLSRVLNTWANSKAFTPNKDNLPDLAFTFSTGVGQYQNESHAVIESGAEINQALALGGTSGVQVQAGTEMRLVALAGIMQLRLNEDALLKSKYNYDKDFNSIGNAISLTGNKSGSFGLGFSYMEQILTNSTTATIETGASVSSGTAGISVETDEYAKTFNFTQSGADSEGGAVAASVGITRQDDSYAVAQVADGARIHSDGELLIDADSTALHSIGVGGFAFGDTVGIGLSAGTVVTNRKTGAFVGQLPVGWAKPDDEVLAAPTQVAATNTIDVTHLSLNASNNGQLTTVAVVASLAKGNNRATGAWVKGAGDRKTGNSESRFRLALSGDTAINVAVEQALAYIDYSGELAVGQDVTVSSANTTDFDAIAGGAAIGWNRDGENRKSDVSVAVTGSVSLNDLTLTSEAELNNLTGSAMDTADDVGGSLTATSHSTGDVFAVAVALGLAVGDTAVSIAGSVSLNDITDVATTGMSGVQLDVGGGVLLDASNTRQINADGGGASFVVSRGTGSAMGVGASIARNEVAVTVDSTMDQGSEITAGSVQLKATAAPLISSVAWAGAGLTSYSSDKKRESLNWLSFNAVGAGAFNSVTTQVRSRIGREEDSERRNSVNTTGTITLTATDDSEIFAEAGSVALELQLAAPLAGFQLGTALSINEFTEDCQLSAEIISSDVVAESESIELTTEFRPEIKAISISVGVGVTIEQDKEIVENLLQVDGVGSAAVNTVSGDTTSRIADSTVSTTQGAAAAIQLEATDSSQITSITPSVLITVSTTVLNFNVGISYTQNTISNTLKSSIENSAVDSASAVIVKALSGTGSTGQPVADDDFDILSEAHSAQGTITLGGALTVNYIGTFVTNKVTKKVSALVTESTTDAQGDLKISARDQSTIRAVSSGSRLLVSAAEKGVSINIGAITQFATNEMAIAVSARVEDSAADAGGAAQIAATKAPFIEARMYTVSVGVSVNSEGAALSFDAATSVVNNRIMQIEDDESLTHAVIDNSTVSATSIDVNATSTPGMYAKIWDVDTQLTVGEVAVAAVFGESKIVSTLDDDVRSTIEGNSTVTATAGAIKVTANLDVPEADAIPDDFDPDILPANIFANTHSVGVTVAIPTNLEAPFAFAFSVIRSDIESTSTSTVIAQIANSNVTVEDGGQVEVGETAIEVSSEDNTTLYAISRDTAVAAATVSAAAAAPNVDQNIINEVEASMVSSVGAQTPMTIVAEKGDINILATSLAYARTESTIWTGTFGVGFATSNSHADTHITGGGAIKAAVTGSDGAHLLQVQALQGNARVEAAFDGHAEATIHSGAVGLNLLSVDTVRSKSSASPQVFASIGGFTHVSANHTVFVQAAAEGHAAGESRQTAVGGFFAGGGLTLNSDAQPDVKAWVGDESSTYDQVPEGTPSWLPSFETRVEGDVGITLRAESFVDAATEARMIGGSIFVTVLSPESHATVKPKVSVNVGPEAQLKSLNVIEIEAFGGLDQSPRPSTFDASRIDDDENTIEYADLHRLQTGNVVQYSRGFDENGDENDLVNGLESDKEYQVIVVTDKLVQLGSQIESSQASVDLDTDQVRFNSRVSFQESFTPDPSAPLTWEQVVNQDYLDAHWSEIVGSWDQIVYQPVVETSPIEGLEPGKTYLVNRVSDDAIMLVDPEQSQNAPHVTTADSVTDGMFYVENGHGFNDGQHVTYRVADPVVFASGVVNVDASTVVDEDGNSDLDINEETGTPSHSIYLGNQVDRFQDGELVRYAVAGASAAWYWTEGPAEPADSTDSTDTAPSSSDDYNHLTGTQFWTGGTAQGGGVENGYANWATSEPNTPDNHYMSIYDDGFWYDSSEPPTSYPIHYVIEYPQFILHDESKDWSDARSFAQNQGGWLPTISSQEEWQRAKTAAAGQTVWLGGSDDAREDTWVWDTGSSHDEQRDQQFWNGGDHGSSPVGATVPWAPGEPNDGGSFTAVRNRETALEMYGDGQWNDEDDDEKNRILVEMPKYVIRRLDSGDFQDARKDAESRGGWIATIGTAEDNEQVKDLLNSSGVTSAWLGASNDPVIRGLENGKRYSIEHYTKNGDLESEYVRLYEVDDQDQRVADEPVAINSAGVATTINHTLTPVKELPLIVENEAEPTTLESGRTYYVHRIDDDYFCLRETKDGDDLQVSNIDPDSNQANATLGLFGFIGIMGVDLTGVGEGLQNLVFDIESLPEKQIENLEYQRGLQAKPDGTGTASSYVHGAGGTILAQAVNPRATSTANPQVDIKLAAGSLVRAARDIDITAVSAGNMAASTEAYGGAIISQARADATSQSDHSAIVRLYGNVHATEHLTVESKISDAGEAHSDTKSYGALTATAKSNAWIRQAFTSQIETDQGARLFAGDSIELNAYSYLSDQMSSRTHSGALFGSSKANQRDDTGIEIRAGDDTTNKNTTEIDIGQASLVADEVYLTAKVLGVDTDPKNAEGEVVEAYGGGMQNANQATGQVTFEGTAEISLEDRAKIVGDKIEIFAIQENLDLYTKAHTRRGRAASKPDVDVTYTGTSKVTSSPGATVVTEDLLVQAEQLISNDDFHAKIKSDRGNSDEDPDNKTFTLTANRDIQWDATVLGREEARLEVDTDGTILVAEGVQLDRYQYVETNQNFTFEQAQADAQSRDGRLVTIRSEQEQQLLEEFIATQAVGDSFWIGASDEGHEGVWKWLEDEEQDVTFWTETGDELFWTGGASGQPVDNAYTNWAPAVQVIDQSVDLDADYGNWGPGKDVAQSFLPGGDNITGASIKLSSVVGWDTTDVTIELHDVLPASSENLLTEATVLDVSPGEWATVQFEEPVTVVPGATYYLVFSLTNTNASFRTSLFNPYPRGEMFETNFWSSMGSEDVEFRTYAEVDVAGPAGGSNDYAALRMSTDATGKLASDWVTTTGDERRYYVLKTPGADGDAVLELRKSPFDTYDTFTWQQAVDDATSRGGMIADVQSAADEEKLRELFHEEFCQKANPRGNCLPNHEYVGLWINATDAVTEGDWRRPVNGFANWNSGEPNNADHNENYAEMRRADGLWNDLPGTQQRPYVLEYDQINVTDVNPVPVSDQLYEFKVPDIDTTNWGSLKTLNGTQTIKGNPLFYARTHVHLDNRSGSDLVVGDVDLVSFGYSPTVTASPTAAATDWVYTTELPAGKTIGGRFFAHNSWLDDSVATPSLQINGTINNPGGVVELQNQSGDIWGGNEGNATEAPLVIDGHEIYISAPSGAIDNGQSGNKLLVRLHQSGLLPPNLVVIAGEELSIDIQGEPDDTGRVRGVDRLQGSVVDIGLRAWDDYSILQDDPVGYWGLNETSGTVARDASHNGINGTYSNANLGQDGAIQEGTGTAVSFSGTDSVQIPDDSRLYGNQAQTVTGWFKVDNLSSDFQAVYFKGNQGTGTTDYTNSGTNRENTFWVTPTGQLHFTVTFTDSAAQEALTTSSDPVKPNTWYHFATVADLARGEMCVYLDGKPIETLITDKDHSIQNTTGDWLLGKSPSGSGLYGSLDDFAIFDTVLSEEQIARQYAAGIADGPYPVDTHYVIDGFVAGLQLDALHREIRSRGDLTITGLGADGTALVAVDPSGDIPTVTIDAHVEIGDFKNGRLTAKTNGDIHLSEGVDYLREKRDGSFRFAEAFTDAATNGRWLTTISNIDEQRIVERVADGDAVWFAANDVLVEGNWDWTDGQIIETPFWLGDYRDVDKALLDDYGLDESFLDVYTNWARDSEGVLLQPVNSYRNEHFLSMLGDGAWDDVPPVWDAPSVEGNQLSWLDAVRQFEAVSLWRLGESSGSEARDSLTAGINGTYVGGALGQAGAIGYDPNTAVQFSTASDYVKIADDHRLYGGQTQTVTGWFKANNLDNPWQSVYFKGDSASNATDYAPGGVNRENTLWVSSSGLVHLAVKFNGIADQTTISSEAGTVSKDQWHYFATVVDAVNGKLQLYVDGNLVAERNDIPSSVSLTDTSGDWRLGVNPNGDSNFVGLLDEVAVYNKALTSAQVELQYRAGIAGRNDEVLFWQGDSTGSAVDSAYTNWNTGEPNNNNGGHSENHVELRVYTDSAGTVSSYWNDVTDDQHQYYVLKTLDENGNPSFELRLDQADTEGKKFTWQEALVDAGNRGGVVANITKRQDEELFVQLVKEAGLLAQEQQVSVWINATDEAVEGEWRRPVQVRGLPYVLETPQGLFSVVDEMLTFPNAWFDAYQRGGWIATVNSAEEQESIAALADGREIWLGASDSRSESFWHWLEPAYRDVPFWTGNGTGAPVEDAFTNWNNYPDDGYPSEPNNDGGHEHFGEVSADGGWNDLPVTSTRSYVSTTRVIRGVGQTSTVGQTMRVASITSSAGNVWLDAPGDVEIDGVIQTGAENTFTWNGTGQVLNDGANPGSSSDLQVISASLQLAGIGGLGSEAVPLHTQVQSLHAFVPIHSIYVRNEGNLDAGDLAVSKGDLQIVTEGVLEIDGPLSVKGGGHMNLVANGSKTVLGMIEGAYTHAEAAADAITRGGRLPVILTEEDQEAVEYVADGNMVWIGATDEAREGDWQWSIDASTRESFYAASVQFWSDGENGSPVNNEYQNWNIGEPNNFNGNENYIELYAGGGSAHGTWNDLNGDQLRHYVLETNGELSLSPQTFTFDGALNDAANRNGHVASITSSEDQQAVLAAAAGNNVWINATDEGHEGEWWRPASGYPVNGHYENWAQGPPEQPDNYQGLEHFGGLRVDGTWNDFTAEDRLPYVLEYDTSLIVGAPVFTHGGDGNINLVGSDGVRIETEMQYIPGSDVHFRGQDNQVNYTQAKTDAALRNGWLAVLTSDQAIQTALTAIDGRTALAGGTDEGHEGDWKWVDSPMLPEDGVTFWLNGEEKNGLPAYWNNSSPSPEPNGGVSENILEIEGDGSWNDLAAGDPRNGYLLQRPSVYTGGYGQIVITAGTAYNTELRHGSNAADIWMQDGSSVTSEHGNIAMLAAQDIWLSNVATSWKTDAASRIGDVLIVADYDGIGGLFEDTVGAIYDNLTGDALNVTARHGVFSAEGSWQNSGHGVGASGKPLHTQIHSIAAMTDNGDIAIRNHGDLTVGSDGIQLQGIMSDIDPFRAIVPVQALPEHQSEFYEPTTGLTTPGYFQVGGLAIVKTSGASHETASIDISAQGSFTAHAAVPILNMTAGHISLNALSDDPLDQLSVTIPVFANGGLQNIHLSEGSEQVPIVVPLSGDSIEWYRHINVESTLLEGGNAVVSISRDENATTPPDADLRYLFSTVQSEVAAATYADGSTETSYSLDIPEDGLRNVYVRVLSPDGQSTDYTSVFTVADVAPTDLAVLTPADPITPGTLQTLTGQFDDLGVNDQHRVTINWADGTDDSVIDLQSAARSFTGSHTYTSPGRYVATVTVTDFESGKSSSSSVTYFVSGVALQEGTLNIIGTWEYDRIRVNGGRRWTHVVAHMNGLRRQSEWISTSDIQQIVFRPYDEGDRLRTIGPVSFPITRVTVPLSTPSWITEGNTKTSDEFPPVSWNTVPGATEYQVWYTNVSTGANPFLLATTTQTTFTPTRVLPIGQYNIWVRAQRDSRNSAWGPGLAMRVWSRVTLHTPDFQQVSLKPKLTWDALSGATSYRIWYDNITTGTQQVIDTTVTGTSFTPSQDLGLGQYRVWVAGIDARGIHARWSYPVDFTVGPQPVAPVIPAFTRRPVFEWTSVPDTGSYELYIHTPSGVLQPAGISGTSWTPDTDLHDGAFYWWVRGLTDSNIAAPWSERAAGGTDGRAALITPTGPGYSGTPLFQWQSVQNAATYILQVQRLSDGQVVIRQDALTTNTHTPATALASGTYRAWVQAISHTGQSGLWSPPADFTVASVIAPDAAVSPLQHVLTVLLTGIRNLLAGDDVWTMAAGVQWSEGRFTESTTVDSANKPDNDEAFDAETSETSQVSRKSSEVTDRPVTVISETPKELALVDQLMSDLSGREKLPETFLDGSAR